MTTTHPKTQVANGAAIIDQREPRQTIYMQLTPAIATEWRPRLVVRNRPMTENHVQNLALAMERGEWRDNGEAFKFDWWGDGLDGQHRNDACILSGVSIPITVERGLDPAVFDSLDQGRKRGGSDVLSLKGEKNTTTLAAALGWILRIQNWDRGRSKSAGSGRKTSNTQMLELIKLYPDMRDSVNYICNRTNKIKCMIPHSVSGYCHWRFTKSTNFQAACTFFDSLSSGEGLNKDDPVHRLRERLIANLSAKAKLPAIHLMALTIKAWNYGVQGRKMQVLLWKDAEDFPEVR